MNTLPSEVLIIVGLTLVSLASMVAYILGYESGVADERQVARDAALEHAARIARNEVVH